MPMKRLGVLSIAIAGLALAIGPVAAQAPGRTRPSDPPAAVRVEAPGTNVAVDERSGETRVTVRAPATDVDVDTERRQVRIRVPYFRGDIRW